MKFAAATTLALAAAVSAGPIQDAISKVNDDIQALTKAVGAYSGDKGPLVSAANTLLSDVDAGTKSVSAAPDLTQDEALQLATYVTGLSKNGEALETALKGKRDQVEKAGECSTVRGIANDLSTKSQALIAAVVPKVPTALQSTAQALSAQLTTTLKQAQDDFSEANCKDATSGGSSSAAPSGGASSAAPTGGASSAAPTGGASSAASTPAASSSAPAASGTAPVTVPKGSAGMVAPAGLFAAAVAAFAL